MKTCIRCGLEKPLKEFHKKKNTKDGYYSQCKECRRIPGYQEKIDEQKELLLLGKKRCSKCEIVKLLKDFHTDKRRPDGKKVTCKECYSRTYEKYYQEYNARYRKNYKKNRDQILKKNANRKYKHRYGITTEEKEKMVLAQGGKCLVCKNIFKSSKDQHVDHDHKTKKVRGILCNNCNFLLGAANDSVQLLQQAIIYLES